MRTKIKRAIWITVVAGAMSAAAFAADTASFHAHRSRCAPTHVIVPPANRR
jgi:hypothetical protein